MHALSGTRVLHVVRQFHPSVGGLENFVLELAKHQRAAGLDARVVTLNRRFHHPDEALPEREQVYGVPVRRIGYRGSYKYPIAPGVLKHLSDYDIVHVHGIDFFSDFLALTKPIHKKKLVLSTHGGFFHTRFASRLKHGYFQHITRRSLRAYDRVFACSASDFSTFRKIRPDRMVTIENGVDVQKFHRAASPAIAPNFVFIGRFSNNKRIDRLIDTFRSLQDDIPEAKLCIVGRESDLTREALLSRVRKSGCEQSIDVKCGLSDQEIRSVIQRSSFFITASEYEGFGLALVEAASAGLIPIANRIPSAEEVIERLGNGLLVDFTEHREAAGQIARFARGSPAHVREDLVQAAETYGWDHTARRFGAEYLDVFRTRSHRVLGININIGTKSGVLTFLTEAMQDKTPVSIAFANAHSLNIAQRSPRFKDTLRRFTVFNDGIGVSLALRIVHGKAPDENLNGTDFIPYFLSVARPGLRVYLLGASPRVVAATESSARTRFPQHKFVGSHHGYLESGDSERVCAEIRKSGADVVLVAMGSPLQEEWIAQHSHETGAILHFAVGGLFDFMSGEKRRAPRWVRGLRCEWAFRLMLEPSRLWRRYLIGNLTFVKNVLVRGGHV